MRILAIMGPDKISVWHDSDDKPTPINLTSLCEIVSTHFDTPCRLAKISEGGYHKVNLYHEHLKVLGGTRNKAN
jgi:hypothetical protein